uniref:Uncharacterized protein n=1 Tax=Arundo donax TaxID=35708 RepID=A0A0A9ANN3_ARUDO
MNPASQATKDEQTFIGDLLSNLFSKINAGMAKKVHFLEIS